MTQNESPNNQPSKNWATAITFMAILVFFLILNAKMIAPFMLSILMGGVLSLLFYPYYQKLRQKHVGPIISSGIVTISVVLIVIIPLLSFGLVAIKQGREFSKGITQNENLSVDAMTEKISNFRFVKPFFDDEQEVKQKLSDGIQKASASAAKFLFGAIGDIPDRLLQLVLGLIACFFFLIDGRRFLVFLHDKIPLDWDVRAKLYHSFKTTAVSVIWATIAAAAVQAAVMFIAYMILGVPGAFLAGGATFIFAWFPFIGSIPVALVGVIYLYTQDHKAAMIAMMIIGVFTGVIDNYVRPLVLKGRDEVHPLVSLVAIFGGIAMFGIVGVFVGPIFAATLIALLQTWPVVGQRFGLIFSAPPTVIAEKNESK